MKRFFDAQPGDKKGGAINSGGGDHPALQGRDSIVEGHGKDNDGSYEATGDNSEMINELRRNIEEKDKELQIVRKQLSKQLADLLGTEDVTAMGFDLAVLALKKGHRVARSGWNGKNMFVYMTVGNTVSKDFIPKFASLPDSVKKFLQEKGEDVVFHPSITMYTAQGEMQPGWLASQADMLATDWQIL